MIYDIYLTELSKKDKEGKCFFLSQWVAIGFDGKPFLRSQISFMTLEEKIKDYKDLKKTWKLKLKEANGKALDASGKSLP